MERIQKYFPQLSKHQLVQIESLQKIYEELNAQINVISRKDIHLLYERHVLHSMSMARLISFRKDAQVIDIGTGGGFPGIPLAILFPETHFHLLDSIGKKIKVVQEVVNKLRLNNVTAEQARAENTFGKYDFIISRAVTALPSFIQWTQHLLSPIERHAIPNGILYLKGGNFDEELKKIKENYRTYPIANWFKEDFYATKYIVHIYP